MSKTIEEMLKEAKNNINGFGDKETIELAERYTHSQTQYLIKSLDAKQGQIDKLIKKYDRREIDFKSQTQELQEQNAELVLMLTEVRNRIQCGKSLTKTNHMVMIDLLLTKHKRS